MLIEGPIKLCLRCADLDHLVYLPSGDTALTRRASKYSTLRAVVVRFSRSRKRNERQGILVERSALERAECECLADSEARARARKRSAERRARLDAEYVKAFERKIVELFPHCPAVARKEIAEHACEKYSGRVGRSAAAKSLASEAVELAVRAHVRHAHTNYDKLLTQGWDRYDAREMISDQIEKVFDTWKDT